MGGCFFAPSPSVCFVFCLCVVTVVLYVCLFVCRGCINDAKTQGGRALGSVVQALVLPKLQSGVGLPGGGISY